MGTICEFENPFELMSTIRELQDFNEPYSVRILNCVRSRYGRNSNTEQIMARHFGSVVSYHITCVCVEVYESSRVW